MEEALKALTYSADRGMTFWDCADIYGTSESMDQRPTVRLLRDLYLSQPKLPSGNGSPRLGDATKYFLLRNSEHGTQKPHYLYLNAKQSPNPPTSTRPSRVRKARQVRSTGSLMQETVRRVEV